MRIRAEHTHRRGCLHLFVDLAYIGMIDGNRVIIMPHLEEHLDFLKSRMKRYKGMNWEIGIPAGESLHEILGVPAREQEGVTTSTPKPDEPEDEPPPAKKNAPIRSAPPKSVKAVKRTKTTK